MNVLYAVATGVMFGFGVFQLLRRDMIKSAMGFYILFTAINLFFFAVGAFNGQVPAYSQNLSKGQPSDLCDSFRGMSKAANQPTTAKAPTITSAEKY